MLVGGVTVEDVVCCILCVAIEKFEQLCAVLHSLVDLWLAADGAATG